MCWKCERVINKMLLYLPTTGHFQYVKKHTKGFVRFISKKAQSAHSLRNLLHGRALTFGHAL